MEVTRYGKGANNREANCCVDDVENIGLNSIQSAYNDPNIATIIEI